MSLINQMLQDLDRRHASMAGSIPLEIVRTVKHATPLTPAQTTHPKLAIGLMGLTLCAFTGWYAATQTHTPLLKIIHQPNRLQAEVISSANANLPESTKANANRQTIPDNAKPADTALLQAKLEEINQLKAQLQQTAEQATGIKLTASSVLAQIPPAAMINQAIARRSNAKIVAEDAQTTQATATDKTSADTKPQFNKQTSPEQESDAAYNQALSILQLGRAPEAQELLAKALSLNPNNHDARQTLVSVLVDLKRNNDAIECLKTGLQLEPQQIGFSQMLARLLIENNQHTDAMSVLVKGLPYAHEDAQYHAFLAALLQREEQHKEAIEHYLIALKHGNQANWLVGLGISLQAEGRMQEAREIYTKAKSAQLNTDLALFVDQRIKQLQQQTN